MKVCESISKSPKMESLSFDKKVCDFRDESEFRSLNLMLI